MMFEGLITNIVLKKGIKGALTALLPYIGIAVPALAKYGIDIKIDQEILTASLIALAGFGIEAVRNYFKHRAKKA